MLAGSDSVARTHAGSYQKSNRKCCIVSLLKNGNELRALLALGGLGSTRLDNAGGVVRSARHDDGGFCCFVLVLERHKKGWLS